MKKIQLFLLALVTMHGMALAQGRTFETRVADILTEMPANNLTILDKQMNELVSLGEKGVLAFTEMLVPWGEGNDVKVRYTLGSLSKFVAKGDREQDRLLVSKAFLKAIERTDNKEIKTFLINQFEIFGKDETVPVLEKYLTDETLCDPAARALSAVGGAVAGKTLFDKLSSAGDQCKVPVVKALGVIRYQPAEAVIADYISTNNPDLKKVSLFYLANLPATAKGKLLEAQAEAVSYKYERTRATASLMLFAERLAQTGQLAKMEKICKNLMKVAPEHIKSDAISLLVKYKSRHAPKMLKKAMNSEDFKLRGTAMLLAAEMPGTDNTLFWAKSLHKYPDYAKAEIITMLGNRRDKAAESAVTAGLKSDSEEVQQAAVIALAKLDPVKAVEVFIPMFATAPASVVNTLKKTMLWMKSDKVVPAVAAAVKNNAPHAKIALMDILATKHASEFKDVIFNETADKDEGVRLAAMESLASVVEKDDRHRVFDLLMKTKSLGEVKALQKAILSIAGQLETPGEKEAFLRKAAGLSDEKKAIFIEILPEVGGKEALQMALQIYKSGSSVLKEAAFRALTNWHGLDAVYPLFSIAEDDPAHADKAGLAIIRQVDRSDAPADQKYLLIRKMFEQVSSTGVKKSAIVALGKIKTIPSLYFVMRFIDDRDLQQDVARAVMNIALPGRGSDGLTGELVKKTLEQAAAVIVGPESDYDKARIQKYLAEMPDEKGFVPIFNGKDLTGWKGLVGNPITRAKMSERKLKKKQAEADKQMRENWTVKDGILWFNGKGHNLCTEKQYGDFELLLDWRIGKDGDSGIYLRGTPQVQIWDTSRVEVGAQVGSGGLYNNQKHPSKPLVVADNPIGEWNHFRIIMKGEKVTVWLNGKLVVDNVVLENYWDRSQPIFPIEQIELQAHGNEIGFRDIYIKELPRSDKNKLTEEEKEEGFTLLFNGENLDGWVGNKVDYIVENGEIVIYPQKGSHGNLFTEKEYGDFVFRFEFKLTPGANNGLGIRAPLEGDAAYVGTEIQILDNTADIYKNLKPYQYHGSAYGIIPAKRGYLKPVGEWNEEEVWLRGDSIRVTLNGTVILEGNLKEASKNGTMDHKEHPGLKRTKGHIGFLGHGSVVHFRNIRIKEL